MHLDTIFTMVDYNNFLFTLIKRDLKTFTIFKTDKGFDFQEQEKSLEEILKEHLHLTCSIDKMWSGDIIASHREQWNDGSNCLAIEPGKVIAYDRKLCNK